MSSSGSTGPGSAHDVKKNEGATPSDLTAQTEADVNLALCHVEAERVGTVIGTYETTLKAQGVDDDTRWHLVTEASTLLWTYYCVATYGALPDDG